MKVANYVYTVIWSSVTASRCVLVEKLCKFVSWGQFINLNQRRSHNNKY